LNIRRFHIFAMLAYACVLFFTAMGACAQDTSSLTGTVTDSSGAVVPKAKITLGNNATRSELHMTTDDGGNYNITNLPSGSYNMHVEAQGFQTTTLNDVRVDPNIGRRVDISMMIGQSTVSITVEANANTVQTESGSVGQLISQEQVKSIQLNGRNPIYLSQLEPGVVSEHRSFDSQLCRP
jgi:hypothetical protein